MTSDIDLDFYASLASSNHNLQETMMETTIPTKELELERKMAETNVEQALDHLRKVKRISQFSAIWLQLRFMGTFVQCAVKRCFEFKSLPNVLTHIQNVGLLVQKLEVDKFDGAAVKVMEELDRLHPEVEQVYLVMSENLPVYQEYNLHSNLASPSKVKKGTRDEEFFKFVSFVREDMILLLQERSDLMDILKNEIAILHEKLVYIDGILGVTSSICLAHKRRDELFSHFQSIVDTAAYLSYCCLVDEMYEERVHSLVLQYSQLTLKIEPSTLEIRELYIRVLKVPRSRPESQEEFFYTTIYFTTSFVKVLIHLTEEILESNCCWAMNMKGQMEALLVELKSLEIVLFEMRSLPNMGGSIEGLLDSEVNIAVEAGCFLFSNYNMEMNEEVVSDVQLALTSLLESMRFHELQVRRVRVDAQYQILPPHFPRTNELGFFDSFVRSLKEMLAHNSVRRVFRDDHFELLHTDLAALRDFLCKISDKRHLDEQIEQIWRKVMDVAYETEYAIDSILASDAILLHHNLWISAVIEKVKLIKEEIKSIQCSENSDMEEDSDEMDDQEEHRVTAADSTDDEMQLNSINEDSQMVGFDEEETLSQILLADSQGTELVFITGMAGQGKTILANKVFDDLSTTKNFDVCVRCTVAQAYDKRSILIKLIKSAGGDVSSTSYDDLVMLLNQRLKKRKYLIVLDDTWEIRAWNDLKMSFPQSAGSKIVFTTRSEDLSYEVGGNIKVIQLQPLSAKKSLELLNMKLFGDGSCPSHLKDIRDQISSRCEGLPLAIILVAGILIKGRNKLQLWKEVSQRPNSYILNDCKGIMELSYNKLPDTLKPCFLYFGAFREDEVIASKKLILLWVAEGFIKKVNEKSLERIAEDFLKDLITRNLITRAKLTSSGRIKEVSIHDLVRNYCLDQSTDEMFLRMVETSWNDSSVKHTSYTDRRLAIHYEELYTNLRTSFRRPFPPEQLGTDPGWRGLPSDRPDIEWSKSSGPLVRTLLISIPQVELKFQLVDVISICQGFKLLRVLDLMRIDMDGELPTEVYILVHLRYLAISGHINHLSDSISRLSNLETLLVTSIHSVRLPLSILSMIKLRHLNISNGFVLHPEITLNKLLEKLENLETISIAWLIYKCAEEGMKRVPKLKKLKYISFGDKLPVLDFLTELESLSVNCQGNTIMSPGVFDISCPFPKCVKKLTLSGLGLAWETIYMLEELKNLEVLELRYGTFKGTTWEVKDEMFPMVKVLKLDGLEFESWIPSDDCEDDSYFRSLEHLELNCSNLMEVPFGLGCDGCLKMIKGWCFRSTLHESMNELVSEQRKLSNEKLKVEFPCTLNCKGLVRKKVKIGM